MDGGEIGEIGDVSRQEVMEWCNGCVFLQTITSFRRSGQANEGEISQCLAPRRAVRYLLLAGTLGAREVAHQNAKETVDRRFAKRTTLRREARMFWVKLPAKVIDIRERYCRRGG
jgi:hypothetical protein